PSSLPRPARHGARFHAFRTAVTGKAGPENTTPRASDPATAEDKDSPDSPASADTRGSDR
ncbi:hypothetical protein, partial [Streptomyces sp. UH6]|uniref:hypothetical protein n=1 Tax=Streptomyces sp. UH6 TaxID=2748379 RepID=UPI001C551306